METRPHREWLAPVALFAACFGNTLWTLAPDVSWGDSGEFITAVHTLGICHPTGYPLYVLTAKILTWLPFGSIALRVNVFSALCGAGASVLVYLTVAHLITRGRGGFPALPFFPRVAAASVAGLGLGLTSILWSQSVIAEVYALHTLLFAGAVYFLVRWAADGALGHLFAGALIASLGMANHVTTILAAPLFLALAWTGWRRSGLRWTALLPVLLPLALGLSLYLFLPLRAAQDPAINWGDPSTFHNLIDHLLGGQFRFLNDMVPITPPTAVHDFNGAAARLGRDFTVLLVFVPFGLVALLRREYLPALAGGLLSALILAAWVTQYRRADNEMYLLPVWTLAALALGLGAGWLLDRVRRHLDGNPRPLLLLSAVLLLMPLANYTAAWDRANQRNNRAAGTYARQVLERVEPGASLLVIGEEALLFWHAKYVEGHGADTVIVAQNFVSTSPWYTSILRREGTPLEARLVVFDTWADILVYRAREIVAPLMARGPVYTTLYNAANTYPGYRAERVAEFVIPPESMPDYYIPSRPTGILWRLVPEAPRG